MTGHQEGTEPGHPANQLDAMTDAELLAAHVAGDPRAFEHLFLRHRDRLWAVALRTMHNREDAADALQEAMISAFRRAGSFRGGSAVTSWLHRIVVNACLDLIRRNKVRRAQPLPDSIDHDPRMAREDNPTGRLEKADLASVVDEALGQLNADQRAALVLVDMEGLSVEDAAAQLGVPRGTVKSRCARGRAKLARILEPLRDTV